MSIIVSFFTQNRNFASALLEHYFVGSSIEWKTVDSCKYGRIYWLSLGPVWKWKRT